MKKVQFNNNNGQQITMAANIFFPDNFDEGKTYPAIVATHPAGGVKEQTSGLYAGKLAHEGFVTIAFDASYQGESTGEPRHLENPYIRVEDISAVIDYLISLPYVNNDRIGALGVCAGGGYTVNAAINDHRINAVGTVSCANFGAMLRNGWEGNQKDSDALENLVSAAGVRTSDAQSAQYAMMPLIPLKEEDAPNEEMRHAWEYYCTPLGQHKNSTGYATMRSLTQVLTYDAFNKAEAFLTQPVLAIVGSKALSKWVSDDLMKRAASKDKQLYVVQGADHMEMYYVPEYVNEAVEQLAAFFKKNL